MTKSPSHISAVAVAVSLVVALAGCASPQSGRDEPIVFSGSVPTHYVDSKQLAGDATELAYGEIVASAEEKISDLTVTRYELRIDESLGGAAHGTLGVYQTGTTEWLIDMPLPRHLKVGARYLLFLTPMGLPRGATGSDGFAIVGPGAWMEIDEELRAYGNVDASIDYGAIPTTLTLESARSLLFVDYLGSNG